MAIKRHAKKFRMKEWKQKMMIEFAHELQIIRSVQAEEMEAQRQDFEMKLSIIGKRLELCETKASSLTDEKNTLKRKKACSDQDLSAAKKNPAAKKAQITGNIKQMDKQVNEQADKQIEEQKRMHRSVSAQKTPKRRISQATTDQWMNK